MPGLPSRPAPEAVLTIRPPNVPLYEVAQEAAVGQGTLSRHFPDRTALLAAVFEAEIDALERRAAGDQPPSLLALLGDIIAAQARMHGLSEALIAAGNAGPQLQQLASRTERLLARPLATAIATGTVRDDILGVRAAVRRLTVARKQEAGVSRTRPRGARHVVGVVRRRRQAVLEGQQRTAMNDQIGVGHRSSPRLESVWGAIHPLPTVG